MRILVVGINYAPDLIGVAKYNTELCVGLASRGHDVRTITAVPYYPEWKVPPDYRQWWYRTEKIDNVKVTRAPIYVPQHPTGISRLFHHLSFAISSTYPVILESLRWQPDVIFAVAPSLMSAAIASWIAGRTGARSWLHLQDFEVDAAFDLGILRNRHLRNKMVAVERAILQSFDRVSTISPQMVDRLISKNVTPANIREFRNWTDTQDISPAKRSEALRKELNLEPSDVLGLYSGTMSHKQGLDLIIEAAKRVEQTSPNVRFVLCGDGPQKAALKSSASGLRNVQVLDLQPNDQFAKLMCTADFHLIPQRAEAADLVLPSKLGGIFATGRPVIVMSEAGTGLAQEVAGAGLIVPPGDATMLAEAVQKLAHNPDLCQSLGARARNIAVTRWDRSTILTKLEQMLTATADLGTPEATSPEGRNSSAWPVSGNRIL
jgi:colanic acid biosynthesis glycosyl transferase WcaI